MSVRFAIITRTQSAPMNDMGLMILADGMGGYNAGEVASGIAVQTIADLAVEGAHAGRTQRYRPQRPAMMRQTIVLRDAVSPGPTRSSTRPLRARRTAKAWVLRWLRPCSTTMTRSRSPMSAIPAHIACATSVFEQLTTGSFAAAGACRSRILFRGRGSAIHQPQLRDPRPGG